MSAHSNNERSKTRDERATTKTKARSRRSDLRSILRDGSRTERCSVYSCERARIFQARSHRSAGCVELDPPRSAPRVEPSGRSPGRGSPLAATVSLDPASRRLRALREGQASWPPVRLAGAAGGSRRLGLAQAWSPACRLGLILLGRGGRLGLSDFLDVLLEDPCALVVPLLEPGARAA